ncbi:MAG: asparagine synthase C-terminal domain-containing protein, partial [candidate division Zixibacteria bacterium]
MFVSIQNRDQAATGKKNTVEGLTELQIGDLIVKYRPNQLYGFSHSIKNALVIGEAIRPPQTSDMNDLLGLTERPSELLAPLRGGIFSALVIDSETQSVQIGQSIASCRPCYYRIDESEFLFSSSLRSLLDCGYQLKIDPNVLPEFMVYRYVAPERTMFEGINRLNGGQLLSFSFAKFSPTGRFSFQFPRDTLTSDQIESASSATCEIIGSAISRNTSDHPTSVLLSGGLDSSLIATLAMRGNNQIDSASSSFSFVESSDGEDNYARTAASAIGLKHEIFSGSSIGYLTGLVESIAAAEGPLHHLQSVMLYKLFKDHSGNYGHTFLSGEAADGLFGNDDHLRVYKHRALIKLAQLTGLGTPYRTVCDMLGIKSSRFRFFGQQFGRNTTSRYHLLNSLGRYTNPALVEKLFANPLAASRSHRAQLIDDYQSEPLLDRITMMSLLGEAHITMATWSKLAESQGYTVYYPFTEPDLISHILSIPWSYKTRESKYVIRKLLRDSSFPESLITRPKLSFAFPF